MTSDAAPSNPAEASPPLPAAEQPAGGPPVPLTRRRLSRFGRLTQIRTSDPMLEPVKRALRKFHPRSDWDTLDRAFEIASYYHRDQKRKSGEPYITHPVAVATILAELGMTGPTVAAALLHDTVEDTDYSLDDLRSEFGDEIAALVDGVT
ncbi:MAG: HD domain-containing protein, partial [Candidatus Nanopelagicales bacterium]